MEFHDLIIEDRLWESAFEVLTQLRTELTKDQLHQVLKSEDAAPPTFTALVVDGRAVAVAGWRLVANVHVGRKVYVDDLSVDSRLRSAGHGSLLLAHLTQRAKDLGCATIDLDSGVQRFDAHRFYLRERFHISSHHFLKAL